MPIYFGSQLIKEARVGTQLYDGYVGSQMVHGKAKLPAFTYDGTYEEHPASYYGLSGDYTVVAFLGSGTLRMSRTAKVDVFMVGGGAAGTKSITATYSAKGGGGGYTQTIRKIEVGTEAINVVIGEGGATSSAQGESTTFGEYSVNGGTNPDGGSGGGGTAGAASVVGSGGSDGSDGGNSGGTGQNTTTRAFAEETGKLFAGGGGAHKQYANGNGGEGGGAKANNAAMPNTGGGGGGTFSGQFAGGSGIVLMRPAQ